MWEPQMQYLRAKVVTKTQSRIYKVSLQREVITCYLSAVNSVGRLSSLSVVLEWLLRDAAELD